ncbi:LLM class flavin-dependent oxidoreductase [Stackebrandtia nassauensis]|uniref:Alkanal monooxygenase (FMN-linked) n=1 Tax=Stackebrandtia nassauensis (strain DSM 44728 / CIP 108903 / NRRL B-16338 / NBRC 102104 / LLR-40K-21) TaxID=446470 RepID=D3Q2C1_STANL|nr:LLM class flavin-dependent oxidoreductase [Stackebrandtia nassauensis]ADD43854.1 Alkanal monooxygenase (FMN-linked) [Stackebrandtia nassauensis DSM 44728]
MKLDLFLVGDAVHRAPHRVPAVLADYAHSAEAAGFDAVWLAEHHFIRYGACPSVPLLAAHILARTETLRVGSAACVLSNRNPVALAEEAAMLDGLSDGRFLLGVARGGPWVDLEVFGTGAERFERGFTESLDIVRHWLSGATTAASDGEFTRFRPVTVTAPPPKPPPMWVAATSRNTVDVAAERGLSLLLGVHATDEDKAAMTRRWAEVAAAAGHDPAAAEHAAVYLAYAADSRESGRRELREPLTHWLSVGVGDYLRLDGSRGSSDQEAYVDRLIDNHLVGPPDDSAERLAASVKATGISRALLLVEGRAETEAVRDNITRLGTALASANSPT